jgi:cyclic-di-GMP phosphodiesterase TipF (flagellum assembly factor)
MIARHSLLIACGAAFAGSVSYAALLGGLTTPVVVAALSGLGGLGVAHYLRNRGLARELSALREHIETTRQQAGALARHTRELRDSIVASQSFQPDLGKSPAAAADFAALSSIIRDVADGLSELDRRSEALETELSDLRRRQDHERAPQATPSWVASAARTAPKDPAPVKEAVQHREMPQTLAKTELRPMPAAPEISRAQEPPRAVRQLVAAAIAADRFDLFLQRAVQLPQRKIRGYEVTLRPDAGDLAIPNEDIRLAVDTLGHQLPFDRRLIVQTVRLARMFERRQREVLLFADVSQRYLMSEAAYEELTALVDEAPTAPQRIVLCLPQRFFRKAIAFEHEALRKLSDLGFRFLMRDIEDFELEPQRLYQMGVRWVRADARHFIDAININPVMMGVSSADFVTMLTRRKIDFLAAGAHDDETVAELIDLGVSFAQGPVFAPPQAVRADALDDERARSLPVEAPRTTPSQAAPVAAERRGLRELVRRA